MQRRLAFGLVALLAACGRGAGARPPSEDPRSPVAVVDDFDAALRAHVSARGVTMVDAVDDPTWLRRVTVDLWGRIPTVEEARAFATDRDPAKREAWTARMLADRRWATHWADVFAEDLLASDASRVPPAVGEGLRTWLTEALHAGRGWDEITDALLTATGDADDGPAAFVATLGRGRRVETLTGQTARVFLGLSVQCAQCHDHPDDPRYTQRDFYGLAAAFARTRARPRRGGEGVEVFDRPRGQMRMPTAHDGPGRRTGPVVAPAFEGLALTPRGDETRREALARAITDSPLLDLAIVDRTWARMMSRGFVGPLDDLGAADDPRHPEPLRVLAAEFRAHDRDLRWLAGRIVGSVAYARASTGPDEDADARRAAFAQFSVRPMTDDELLASLIVATGIDDTTDHRLRRRLDAGARTLGRQFEMVFDDDADAIGDAQGNVSQALVLLNGPLTSVGTLARRDTTVARALEASDAAADRIDALYLAALGRVPSSSLRAQLVAHVQARPGAAPYEDLMHALLSSAEFTTNH